MKPSRPAKAFLQLAGWQYEGPIPREPKYVALAVPHTSNWDALLLVLLTRSIGVQMEWMIKDAWVRGPMRPVMHRYGAIGIDRKHAKNVVDQMIAQFERRDAFVLGIPPEGTRGAAEYWKSGFYHIALGAKVPVVPGYLDYARKRAGLGPALMMTGDARTDMDAIRAFYAEKNPRAREPSGFGAIRLREEAP
jgi:1-acyl-sn-glycerol-3-phosphate acyltransferase